MSVEIINRFNGGNGGASIVITREIEYADGSSFTEDIGEFVSAQRAREIALDLLRNSVPDTTFKQIEELVNSSSPPSRVTIPVKGS